MAVKKNFLLPIFLIIDITLLIVCAQVIALRFSPLSKSYEKQLFENIVTDKLWLNDNDMKAVPNGIIKVIWHRNNDKNSFTPLLYDTDSYKISNFSSSSRLSSASFNVYKMKNNDGEYIAWIKPFSLQVCMRYILIPVLASAVIILFFNCIFILLFVPKANEGTQTETDDKENGETETKTYELTPEEIEGLLGTDEENEENEKNNEAQK